MAIDARVLLTLSSRPSDSSQDGGLCCKDEVRKARPITRMKLKEYALIAEIIGGIAVQSGLVFVGLELRQNTLMQ